MFINNYISQPTVSYDKAMSMLRNLPQEKIDEAVNRAKNLGISESFITQGLQIINQLKSESV